MHTKGEWTVGKEKHGFVLHNKHKGIYCHEGNSVIIIAETVNGLDKGEADANARLIAAAPSMYLSLKAIADCPSGQDPTHAHELVALWKVMARIEIDKAEGR